VRGALTDELRRRAIKSRFRVRPPTAAAVDRFRLEYAAVPFNLVAAIAVPPWAAGPNDTAPLAAVPWPDAQPVILAALDAIRRDQAYMEWLVRAERAALEEATCLRDELPEVAVIDVSDFLPFL
jgi:hypothetical protein